VLVSLGTLGIVFGGGMTLTANTMAAVKPKAYFDNSTIGPRLVGDSDLRIDLSGAYNWYLNSTGGLQLSISTTANAVNRWNLTGSAAGGAVVMTAVGGDAVIHGAIKGKGAGGQAQLQSGNGGVRVAANDTGLGFNGTTPIAKPSVAGSRGGNAALASLLSQLAATGLITDNTGA
jgi:hypothetical protein